VAYGEGVAEKFRRKVWDGEMGNFATGDMEVRSAGVRNVRNSEVAMVLMS
jgi:hypothetical protein